MHKRFWRLEIGVIDGAIDFLEHGNLQLPQNVIFYAKRFLHYTLNIEQTSQEKPSRFYISRCAHVSHDNENGLY